MTDKNWADHAPIFHIEYAGTIYETKVDNIDNVKEISYRKQDLVASKWTVPATVEKFDDLFMSKLNHATKEFKAQQLKKCTVITNYKLIKYTDLI